LRHHDHHTGKTLAYALPLMQRLKQQEVFPTAIAVDSESSSSTMTTTTTRPKHRPRGLILVPTRELALQIKNVLKTLAHGIKLSVQIICGGESVSKQRRYLESNAVDIIVATPGRLIQHVNDYKTVVLNNRHLQFIVLDEMDTMLEQGFANDLASLLYPLLYHKKSNNNQNIDPVKDLVADGPSVWLTSATMTQAVQKMMGDDTYHDQTIQARRHYVKNNSNNDADGKGREAVPEPPQIKLVLPKMKVLRAAGLHKVVPTLNQVFVDVGNNDKLALMLQYVDKQQKQKLTNQLQPQPQQRQTMIFCNTASACRAVEYALKEAGHDDCLSYHGDLNSSARADNLVQFRTNGGLLVCTDLAARGLDVPMVDHVIMFDFPLNALDYLHRSGRTARGTRDGTVTALITKRDVVLATAIEQAVKDGAAIDGLSSRKSDYQWGGRLHSNGGSSSRSGSAGGRASSKPRESPRSRAGYSSGNSSSRAGGGPQSSARSRTGSSSSSSAFNRGGTSSSAARKTEGSFGRAGGSSSRPGGRATGATSTARNDNKRRATAGPRR
jgi:superfamily II DNA/RNA helicase